MTYDAKISNTRGQWQIDCQYASATFDHRGRATVKGLKVNIITFFEQLKTEEMTEEKQAPETAESKLSRAISLQESINKTKAQIAKLEGIQEENETIAETYLKLNHFDSPKLIRAIIHSGLNRHIENHTDRLNKLQSELNQIMGVKS